ncbi:MAG: pyridoxal-phosphate dependent enzyme [Acidimicrobiia bacterium]|nr:pyridoxal-phosphate dependent enzyme [Acidimicrobiia bacterium]
MTAAVRSKAVALTVDPPSGLLPDGDADWEPAPEQPPLPPVADESPLELRRRIEARLREHRRRLATHHGERALHAAVPGLCDVVHFRHLADGLPTPVEDLGIAGTGIWVKRDDATSSLYGGNKVRKLEYLLAQPARHEAVVVTGGGTASHHVAATVLYARLLGLETEVALFAQPPNPAAARLRSLLRAYDVATTYAASTSAYPLAMIAATIDALRRGRRPWPIYPGGSTPAGILGYVDCGLEIAAAVDAGDCPPPRAVYVALGSGGTAVGLALGLAMGGVETKVRAVRVTDALVNNRTVLAVMEAGTRALLALAGARVGSALETVEIVDGYMGAGYGVQTPESVAALQSAQRLGLPAEQTYTSKALTAALDAAREHPSDAPVLFVDTASGQEPLSR